jgi:hypothetical protein
MEAKELCDHLCRILSGLMVPDEAVSAFWSLLMDYYTNATHEERHFDVLFDGVLDVINSGSAMELDQHTIEEIKRVVKEKNIHTLWFEAHYMYRHKLAKFAEQFEGVQVKFRCGIESFDGALREQWKKGVATDVTAEDVAKYFQGVCLLCCTEGDSKERILRDIVLAQQYFEYASVNVFCENTTQVKRDNGLAQWFVREVYPELQQKQKIEILIDNTDLGVG